MLFHLLGRSGERMSSSHQPSPPPSSAVASHRVYHRRGTLESVPEYPYRCCCKKCHPLGAVMAVCLGHVTIFGVFLLNSVFNTDLEKIGSSYAVITEVMLLFVFGFATICVLYGFWKTRPRFLYVHLLVQALWIGCLLSTCIYLGSLLVNAQKSESDIVDKRRFDETLSLVVISAVFILIEVWWLRVIWRSGVLYLRFKERTDAENGKERGDVVGGEKEAND